MNEGGFALEQLMELAGLSVAEAGGDGLVAARHLFHFGYKPTIYYPKPSKPAIFVGLQKQLKNLNIPFTEDFHSELKKTSLIIDAIFGFSFKGPPREPFSAVVKALEETKVPILAVDAPSSWDIDGGPPPDGQVGHNFMPDYLISLTAAKPLCKHFKGKRHFLGGRFLSKEMAAKYDLDVPDYQGVDQIVEVPVGAEISVAGGEKL
ncbi:putative ai-bp family protein [Phaeomoniella chlamydospora]|uniref:NAD(P)H-hydrate epimerase n=1 Tax=Phaeomoniella chlamydospora TaxID=158046 RepID=A0A0G2ES84_PHACM|nr:putative ai-bp family protein [Phaeomoniella chlamydospora]